MEFTEWDLPILTLPAVPMKIVLGGDGAMWFAELFGPAVGRIDDTGGVMLYPIAEERVGAYGITRGLDGNVWYTAGSGGFQSVVGRVTTKGEMTEFLLPPGPVGSGDIALGPDGNLWTIAQGDLNAIVRVTHSGAIATFALPTAAAGPWGICAGPDGNIWFTEVSLDRIGKLFMSTTPVELMRFTAE
jgi:virginiamycin B lyase